VCDVIRGWSRRANFCRQAADLVRVTFATLSSKNRDSQHFAPAKINEQIVQHHSFVVYTMNLFIHLLDLLQVAAANIDHFWCLRVSWDASWLILGASRVLLDASWVSPGCIWASPGCLLSDSWARLGVSWVTPGCLPGVSWCLLVPGSECPRCLPAATPASQMPPRCK